jgi:hypothetical protein
MPMENLSYYEEQFADGAGNSYTTAKSDFEIEISEATALLRYLQLVPDTFEVSAN